MRAGVQFKQRKSNDPPAVEPKEAAAYHKLRLDAAKILIGLYFGTKSHGPIKPGDISDADKTLQALREMPEAEREQLFLEQVASGDLSEEGADELRAMTTNGKDGPSSTPDEKAGDAEDGPPPSP